MRPQAAYCNQRHCQKPLHRSSVLPRQPGQDSLKGSFHASLIVILEFVLIADQREGVRDSKLGRHREKKEGS